MKHPLFESVQILRLRPDDIVVLEFDRKISADEVLQVVEQGREVFPDNKVIVTSSLRLRVMRKEDEPKLYKDDE